MFFYVHVTDQHAGESLVSVTLGKLMILDTHTNRYLGDCAPDITAISIGYGVSDFNAVLVIELQVRT